MTVVFLRHGCISVQAEGRATWGWRWAGRNSVSFSSIRPTSLRTFDNNPLPSSCLQTFLFRPNCVSMQQKDSALIQRSPELFLTHSPPTFSFSVNLPHHFKNIVLMSLFWKRREEGVTEQKEEIWGQTTQRRGNGQRRQFFCHRDRSV